jgi:hypothetical protein
MSVSFGCKCKERKKPIKDRDWSIRQYMSHHSAFSGYKYTPSAYSELVCNNCSVTGRTKANYVGELFELKGEL